MGIQANLVDEYHVFLDYWFVVVFSESNLFCDSDTFSSDKIEFVSSKMVGLRFFMLQRFVVLVLVAGGFVWGQSEAAPEKVDLRALIKEPVFEVGQTFMNTHRTIYEVSVRINVGEQNIVIPDDDVERYRYQLTIDAVDEKKRPTRMTAKIFYSRSEESLDFALLEGKTVSVVKKGEKWDWEAKVPGVSESSLSSFLQNLTSLFDEYTDLMASLPKEPVAIGESFPAAPTTIINLIKGMDSGSDVPLEADLDSSKLSFKLVSKNEHEAQLNINGIVVIKLKMSDAVLSGSFELDVDFRVKLAPFSCDGSFAIGTINAAGNANDMLVKMSGEMELVDRSYSLEAYKAMAAKAEAYAKAIYDASGMEAMLYLARDAANGSLSNLKANMPEEAATAYQTALEESFDLKHLRAVVITELAESYDERYADEVLKFYLQGQGPQIKALEASLPNDDASGKLIMDFMNTLEGSEEVTNRSEHLGYFLYGSDIISSTENLTIDTSLDLVSSLGKYMDSVPSEEEMAQLEVQMRQSVSETISDALIFKYYYLFREKPTAWLAELAEFSQTRNGIWAGETVRGAMQVAAREWRSMWLHQAKQKLAVSK